jgi:putative membrane protein
MGKSVVGIVVRCAVICVVMWVSGALASGRAAAAEPPSTADVLGKLYRANQKEVDMGRMAAEHGKASDVRSYGKMLVKDHLAAEKKVEKLAKEENISLTNAAVSPTDMQTLPAGDEFDATFSKTMLEDHHRDITELEAARDTTDDPKLKRLLNEILPTLHKHEDTARRLVDKASRS